MSVLFFTCLSSFTRLLLRLLLLLLLLLLRWQRRLPLPLLVAANDVLANAGRFARVKHCSHRGRQPVRPRSSDSKRVHSSTVCSPLASASSSTTTTTSAITTAGVITASSSPTTDVAAVCAGNTPFV